MQLLVQFSQTAVDVMAQDHDRATVSLAQLLVALLLIVVAASAVLAPADAPFGVALGGLTLWLVKSDLEDFELPDLGNLAVAALGLVWIVLQPDPVGGLLHATLRATSAAACLASVKWAYASLRGVEGLGWGDVKLAAAGAVWLDWPQLPIALLVAAVAGLLVVGGREVLGAGRITASTAMPFGAFLAPAVWLVWVAGAAALF